MDCLRQTIKNLNNLMLNFKSYVSFMILNTSKSFLIPFHSKYHCVYSLYVFRLLLLPIKLG